MLLSGILNLRFPPKTAGMTRVTNLIINKENKKSRSAGFFIAVLFVPLCEMIMRIFSLPRRRSVLFSYPRFLW
jgi:hypothetical protein